MLVVIAGFYDRAQRKTRAVFMKKIKKLWLKICNKLRKLLGKRKMEIDKTINNWFEETENALEYLSPADKKNTNIYFLIRNCLATFANYLHAAMMILGSKRRLPAKALLRVSGQLVSRVSWVLKGKDEQEQQNRLKRWIKDSYVERHRWYNEILEYYADEEKAQIEKSIRVYSEEIDKLEKCNIKKLPQPKQVLEQAFGKSNIVSGMYSQYHDSVHPDLLVLSDTIREYRGMTMCEGDTAENIDDLKFECLIQVYIFFKEIHKFYDLDFQEIESGFQVISKSFIQ